MTARTDAMERAYQEARAAGTLEQLNEVAPLKEWAYWKLIPNRFPHDKLNVKHLMIVLKREANIWEIEQAELNNLWRDILPSLDAEYDYVKINLAAMRSVANVPHLHVAVYRSEFR